MDVAIVMEKLEFLESEFKQALLQVNRTKAEEIFEKIFLMENSFALLEKLAINTLENIGDGWENGTISLSQVYMSGIITLVKVVA